MLQWTERFFSLIIKLNINLSFIFLLLLLLVGIECVLTRKALLNVKRALYKKRLQSSSPFENGTKQKEKLKLKSHLHGTPREGEWREWEKNENETLSKAPKWMANGTWIKEKMAMQMSYTINGWAEWDKWEKKNNEIAIEHLLWNHQKWVWKWI